MLKEINRQLDTLYRAYGDRGEIRIWTHIYIEGDPVNFIFSQEDNKYSRLTTPPVFAEWMAACTGNWRKAAPAIEKLAASYGVAWDNENGALYLRFRRNETSIAEAVIRLHQAVAVVSAIGNVQ